MLATVIEEARIEEAKIEEAKTLLPRTKYYKRMRNFGTVCAIIPYSKNSTRPKWNVPFAAVDQVNKELEKLESLNIIEKIDHADSAAPAVYVKKKNKLRVCADFSARLNDYLLTHNNPLPSPEEVFAKLNGGKSFLKLYLSEAYPQIQLLEDCIHLLIINTHFGFYKFKRLPFGVKVTPAIFQQIMDALLSDCNFAIAYPRSDSRVQHVEHIKKVFEGISEYDLKLTEEKCELFRKK
ncbi:uncharacterized protein K02A2.6-like [Octopus bimaculoides]|uniref:uncharacterized protein K02A2.6-like n=1 Tax=Octopus bimaculoides TaxID=37653 RepID=UPI0022E6CA09|nr:uncharacterized protein K02A2.6-like [Octopus bimaculoides]